MSSVVNVLFYTRCDGCLVWWMSCVVEILCGGWTAKKSLTVTTLLDILLRTLAATATVLS